MEAAQLSIQKFLKTITEEEEREVQQQGEVEEHNDEEFYEEIEAPKFVDFTASDDPFRPDDCYWFCLRVGCDRKHEEELDPEEISKNFVLRVMAARSPNVRLRRALNGRNMSGMKCPLSAPAKSSRSRLPRLAMVSSMSQKMLDVKEKAGSHPKINSSSTPMVKGKQVASKYMTTPRNKMNLSHQTSFRSVQNPRLTKTAVPKSRLIAKALVFRSPKKDIPTKTAVELHTPLTKLCEGMKRLEITSQRKRVLYTGKSAKGTKCTQNSIATESSRKPRTIQDGKCLPLCHRNCKGKEAKYLKTDKTNSNKQKLPEPFEKVSDDDPRKERIDVKSKDCSALDFSVSEGNAHGEALKMTTNSSKTIINTAGNENNSSSNLDTKVDSVLCHAIAAERNEHKNHLKTGVSEKEVLVLEVLPNGENSDLLTGNAVGEICSLPSLEGVDVTTSPAIVEGIEGKDIIKREERTNVSSKNELLHGDDKENGHAPDENRAVNCNNNHSKKKLLGRKQTHENGKRVVREVKDGLSTTTTAAPDVKNRKPKPTNPKPFRLRTDERGILKEANMEKKLHHPRNQAAVVSSFLSGTSQRRRGNDTKENEKCSVQSNGNTECVDKESSKEVQQAAAKLSRTARLQAIREQACRTPQRRHNSAQKIPNHTTSSKNDINDNENKKPEDCIRKQQSSSLGQLIRPQGKVMNSSKLQGNGLCVIKETSKAKSTGKPYQSGKSTGKPYQSGIASSTKSTTSAAFRSSSRVPIFHSVSVPRHQGCAKNIVV